MNLENLGNLVVHRGNRARDGVLDNLAGDGRRYAQLFYQLFSFIEGSSGGKLAHHSSTFPHLLGPGQIVDHGPGRRRILSAAIDGELRTPQCGGGSAARASWHSSYAE